MLEGFADLKQAKASSCRMCERDASCAPMPSDASDAAGTGKAARAQFELEVGPLQRAQGEAQASTANVVFVDWGHVVCEVRPGLRLACRSLRTLHARALAVSKMTRLVRRISSLAPGRRRAAAVCDGGCVCACHMGPPLALLAWPAKPTALDAPPAARGLRDASVMRTAVGPASACACGVLAWHKAECWLCVRLGMR